MKVRPSHPARRHAVAPPPRAFLRAVALAFALAASLVLLGSTASVASVAASPTPSPSCLPQVDQTGCVVGTVGSRSDPVADADVMLLDADGAEVETQTTGDDGRFAFTVEEPGQYSVVLDNDSLPEGLEQLPPPAQFAGPDGSVLVTVELGASAVPALEVRSVDFDASGSTFSEDMLQGAANGIKLGLLLALASLGLSLIYGTTGLSNFAHAEQVTLGGVVAYGLVNVGGMNLWLGIVVTVVICAATGWIQDRGLWQPLRRRRLGLTQMMIVTIGLSLAAQYAFQYFIGGSLEPVVVRDFGTTTIGSVRVTNESWIAMAVSIVAIAAVGYALLYTRIGRATRAVSDNPALAAASGIDVDRIIRLVWTVSAGLAGLAGVFYALSVSNGIKWDTGLQILLLLFAAVTLGGLGTAWGALVGSLIIGLVVELANPLGLPGDLKYAVALVMLILILLVRPQGILGRAVRVG